ncbi:MAG TPA: glycoside hydrolase family 15 protein [Armatimonadota bacterium]|nr:glycoside hydrolase family 15 protein [Armatimonadota bacterium]
MPRDLPLGNGTLLVNFDRSYNLSDLYYPNVGAQNHADGHPCRFGVWVDGCFAWLSDPSWQRTDDYEGNTLVTHVTASNPGLGLLLTLTDAVDFDAPVYVKQIHIENLNPAPRDIRLFFHFDCYIGGTEVGNTAYFEPRERTLVMYRDMVYLLMGAICEGREGLSDFATGKKQQGGLEGTWRDAEDGELGHNPISQGAVDCVGQLNLTLPAGGAGTAYFWLTAGANFGAVNDLHAFVKDRRPEHLIERTRNYWRLWANKQDVYLADLSPEICTRYRRSLLILRTQIDCGGAILAANDSDILRFGMDTYSYMWPRDGALVAEAMVRAGYMDLPRKFFYFLRDLPTADGYLLHKYNPDGSRGSSWHPWVDVNGHRQLPIQEDETALPLYALWRFYERFREVEAVGPLYKPLIKHCADFLVHYRDPATHLPRPSYDLWEERRGVLSYTTGAVWAGLAAAGNFAEAFGDIDLAAHYRAAAEEVKQAALKHLYDPDLGRFVRRLYRDEQGQVQKDTTLDASIAGLFMYGMLPADHPGVVVTMTAIEERLWCKTADGGLCRYEDDYYFQVSQDLANVPGNPWFICTLWLAQWHIQKARSMEDLARPVELIQWVARHALRSGVLAEQVNPYDGRPLSVSPLTWSHAEFISTVLQYAERYQEIHLQKLQDAGKLPLLLHKPHVEGVVMKPDGRAEPLVADNPAAAIPGPSQCL